MHHWNPLPPHRETSRQFLLCFSAVEFEPKLIVRKAKLGKDDENPSNDHEITNCGPFLTIVGNYFKISLQHVWEYDFVVYKDISF